ncbi:MAG TPA: RagB/SusD family nutrient uptake outer membrane protein, partial [Puia sp.]|nr:RagB/SusD family nutrient uptake outer membrane protein [Puia sp.]
MNKYKINYLGVLMLGAGLAFGSCSKSFVDKSSSTNLSTSEALSTPELLKTDLNGLYAQLRNVDLFGRDFPVLGDLEADNTFLEDRNTGRYNYQFAYSVPVTDNVTQAMWQQSYSGILYANQIIDAPVTGSDAAVTKAQAYALRALLYFKLVNIFAQPYTFDSTGMGVPLVLHYDVTATPGRATVAQVYHQIISDLRTSMVSAPEYTSSIFISKYAVEGLLARAYMYMGDYGDAAVAAVDVINNSPFTLVSAGAFRSFWADAGVQTSATEVMFEVDADAINNNGFDDLGGIYFNGYQDIYCSLDLAELYSATDVRTQILYSGFTKGGQPAILVGKFPNAQSTDRDNLKVIRLAEVYLIAAESEARLGDNADAQDYVNALAETRDPVF